MNKKENSPRSKVFGKRVYLIILIIIFIGPVIAAWTLYFNRSHVPRPMNHGHLIQPPLDLSQFDMTYSNGEKVKWTDFKGKWVLLYLVPKSCNQLCSQNLLKMRQIRLALGKNMSRLQRVMITIQGNDGNKENILKDRAKNSNLGLEFEKKYPGTLHLITKRSSLNNLLRELPSYQEALSKGYLYLADPLGNLIMSYQPNSAPKGIYEDLTRLLKTSKIG